MKFDTVLFTICIVVIFFVLGIIIRNFLFQPSVINFKYDNATNIIDANSVNNTNEPEQEQYDGPLVWYRMPVRYTIATPSTCRFEQVRLKRAFRDISNATNNTVTFAEVESGEAELYIHCKLLEDCYEEIVNVTERNGFIYESFTEIICQHDLGYAQITQIENNKIKKANITIIGLAGFAESGKEGFSGFYVGNCGDVSTEIHEILHTFGYEHTKNSDSIMYPSYEMVGYTIGKREDCREMKIDKALAEDLISKYSK